MSAQHTVQRIFSARGLKPHLIKTFKLSNDPGFDEKLIDVVGFYLNPPEKAIVLCADEKSSVQAPDRTQASLPMIPGRALTMTHDYKRHGTTTLFAALNVLTGTVILQCLHQHRHQEFLQFLRTIDHEVPKGVDDPYDSGQLCHPQTPHRKDLAPQTSQVSAALHPDLLVVAQPRRTMVPRTHLQSHQARLFYSVPDLITSIEKYLNVHNDDPNPYVWTATAESILTKVASGRVALEKVS